MPLGSALATLEAGTLISKGFISGAKLAAPIALGNLQMHMAMRAVGSFTSTSVQTPLGKACAMVRHDAVEQSRQGDALRDVGRPGLCSRVDR